MTTDRSWLFEIDTGQSGMADYASMMSQFFFKITDLDVRQMENAAILASSWQRPSLIIDPYDEGVEFLSEYSKLILRQNLVTVDDNV